MLRFFGLFVVLLFFGSCNLLDTNKDDVVVAKAYGNYLYLSDLDGLVKAGLEAADSTVIVKRYIDNWVRQQVFLNQALTQMPPERIDFERQIEDYKNSLIIFAYENELIKSRLDTVISPELIQEYFEKHQNDFKLRDHIVKVNYVKLPLDAPDVNLVRRLIRSDKEEDMIQLEEFALNHAAGFFLDQESWFIFSDILRDIPINPQNHESFLRNNRFLELNDQFYRYFLFIREYKLEGSVSPLAYQSENIKAIILNHRKQSFINEFRQETYKQAANNNDFEIY